MEIARKIYFFQCGKFTFRALFGSIRLEVTPAAFGAGA